MDIQSNLKEVRAQLPPQVSLVAVSKFHPNEAILAAYETGQRIFGESKEQELSKKQASLPAEAVEVAAAASLEGDGDRQRRSDDLVIFLSDVDIFRPGELFQSSLDELGAVTAFFLPQCHDCRLIRRLHQTIH